MHWIGAALLLLESARPAMAQTASDPAIGIGLLIVGLIFLVIYFLPTMIGRKRGISSSGALFFVNLFFGWTGLVWLLCLLWAATGATRAQDSYFKNQTRTSKSDLADGKAFQEAYAKERARLDYEAEQKANRGP